MIDFAVLYQMGSIKMDKGGFFLKRKIRNDFLYAFISAFFFSSNSSEEIMPSSSTCSNRNSDAYSDSDGDGNTDT